MIYIYWPTCRPDMMFETYNIWINKAVHPEDIKIKIAVDNEKDKIGLQLFNVIVVDNPRGGVTIPVYELTKNEYLNYEDIMIVASDDFYPPQNWDMYLKEIFHERSCVFKVNDGNMKNIIALPVMNYASFQRLNRIIYNPVYEHMFSDQELHDISQELGICYSADYSHPLWQHKHPVFGTREPDEFDTLNNQRYKRDKEVYSKRVYLSIFERMKFDGI